MLFLPHAVYVMSSKFIFLCKSSKSNQKLYKNKMETSQNIMKKQEARMMCTKKDKIRKVDFVYINLTHWPPADHQHTLQS